MNKPQVKALLEVISSDEARPVLTHAMIDILENNMVLVATDSYKLAAVALSTTEDDRTHVGKFISRELLTKWYKLANTKDILSTQELLDMAKTDESMKFPKWQSLLEQQKAQSTSSITFNAQYALTLEKLAGQPLSYKLHGDMGAMRANINDSVYLLMPMKS